MMSNNGTATNKKSFKCKHCGKCKTFKDDLQITPMDLLKYCKFLNLTPEQFIQQYTTVIVEPEKLNKVIINDKREISLEESGSLIYSEEDVCPVKEFIKLTSKVQICLGLSYSTTQRRQEFITKFFEDFYLKLDTSDDNYLTMKLEEWDNKAGSI